MERADDLADSDGEQEAVPRFAEDSFYRAFAARPRRRALAYLLEAGEASTAELADVLCGWDLPSGAVADADAHGRYRLELRHTHLPVLDDASLVSYDPSADRVELGELHPQVKTSIRRSVAVER